MPLTPVVWSDELSYSVLLKGVGLGMFLSTGVVILVNYMEANLVYICGILAVIAVSLAVDVVMSELRLFPPAAAVAEKSAAVEAVTIQLETVRASQVEAVLAADILRNHLRNPSTFDKFQDPALVALLRRNYLIFQHLDPFLKQEAKGCLKLLSSRDGEIAISSTFFRVLVTTINAAKLTQDIHATLQHFDENPVNLLLVQENLKQFRAMKAYVDERARIQKFNSLKILNDLMQDMKEQYD